MATDDTGRDSAPAGSQAPAPMVPVSAEDFFRRKRRIIFAWIGAAVLVSLVAFWAYRRSVEPLEAQRSVEEGRRLFKATRYTESILSLDHALALKRDLVEAYLLRGRAKLALSLLDPAIQDFSEVIRLRPDDAEAFVERAEARLAQQDYAQVIADCGSALKIDPRLALAYNLRGIAIRQSGNPYQSLQDFTKAIELAPDEPNYFQRAATYQTLGQHKLAITDLDQVIALKPDGPQAYFARAQSRRATGDTTGANQDHAQATRLEGR